MYVNDHLFPTLQVAHGMYQVVVVLSLDLGEEHQIHLLELVDMFLEQGAVDILGKGEVQIHLQVLSQGGSGYSPSYRQGGGAV